MSVVDFRHLSTSISSRPSARDSLSRYATATTTVATTAATMAATAAAIAAVCRRRHRDRRRRRLPPPSPPPLLPPPPRLPPVAHQIKELANKYSEFIAFPIQVWTETTKYEQVPDESAEAKEGEPLPTKTVSKTSYEWVSDAGCECLCTAL
jgi:Hsp90 protein